MLMREEREREKKREKESTQFMKHNSSWSRGILGIRLKANIREGSIDQGGWMDGWMDGCGQISFMWISDR